MRNSETFFDVRTRVDNLLEQLSEEEIKRRIDNPVDHVMESIVVPPVTCRKDACRTIAGVVSRISLEATPPPRRLTHYQSMSEAVCLLESSTQGGIAAALLDAVQYEGGMTQVTQQLAGAIKERQRRQYIECVLASELADMDWGCREQIVCEIQRRQSETSDFHVAGIGSEELVSELSELILLAVDAKEGLRRALDGYESPVWPS